MIPRASLEQLTAALGHEAVEQHEPLEIDGARPELTLRPPDGEVLGRALRALGTCGLAALVEGDHAIPRGERVDHAGKPPL